MIKVGMIIRMRIVIIAFLHSLSERPRRSKIDIWTGALFPHFLGLAGNGRAIDLRRTLLPPRLTPFDRRFGDTVAVFRACCGRSRIQAGVASGIGAWRVSTRVAPLARPAFPGCQRRAVEAICRAFYERCTARLYCPRARAPAYVFGCQRRAMPGTQRRRQPCRRAGSCQRAPCAIGMAEIQTPSRAC